LFVDLILDYKLIEEEAKENNIDENWALVQFIMDQLN